MDKKRIELKHPIKIPDANGNDIETNVLSLGSFKAKHLKLLPKGLYGKNKNVTINPYDMIPIIAGLAEIPVKSAEELYIGDLIHIVEEMEDFLGGFLETGNKFSGE